MKKRASFRTGFKHAEKLLKNKKNKYKQKIELKIVMLSRISQCQTNTFVSHIHSL